MHFSAVHFSQKGIERPKIVRKKFDVSGKRSYPFRVNKKYGISSYLDEYPDFNLDELLSWSSGPRLFNGMYVRGNFFIHREPGQSPFEAIQDIPATERDALAAYLNPRSVQQRPRPT
ncbi:MAG: hypothetical protein ABEJ72_07815, partial [Candidatus Aenigmatarchaeota archaeon]